MKRAILLSGGVDSIALSYWKKPEVAFTIDYGQRPYGGELRAATQVASQLGIQHELVRISCDGIGSGDLAGKEPSSFAPAPEWWPYRNQLLLTACAMKAISLNVTEIMIGTVSTDGFHKDGTPAFVQMMNDVIAYQEGSITVTAPAISMTSVELVKASGIPDSLLLWAHSCHKSDYACGNCRGCSKYQQVMNELYGPAATVS